MGETMTMKATVVPGSGTGGLRGIARAFSITIECGVHSRGLDDTLPEALR
jgi:hypothetical protein